ncbi:MAG: A24 family peptidase [Bacillota bacterium]|nr:A24 family peptidase [Bacillota bacterium]
MQAAEILILTVITLLGVVGAALVINVEALMMRKRGFIDELPRVVRITFPVFMAALFGSGYIVFGLTPELAYLALMALLTALITIIDVKHRLIPNTLVLAVFVITAAFAWSGGIEFDWLSSLYGLLICFGLFIIPLFFGDKVGMGDVKLAAAIGFASGFYGSLYTIILMGFFILATTYIQRGVPYVDVLKTKIPMGPFIMTAFMVIQVVV